LLVRHFILLSWSIIGRTRKPSSKIAFLEAASAEAELKQQAYAAAAPERAAKRKERLAAKREKERAKIKKKKPKKAKKAKKDKKNGGIKRALSAYMYYVSEKRSVVMSEYPDSTFGEVGRILGQWWRECPDHERVHYDQLAARDKQRYEREISRGGAPRPSKPRKAPKVQAARAAPVKTKKALKSWNNKDGQKSYYDMICEAILVLKDRKGSSSIAIENHITANNSISFKRHVMRASLKTHTAAGRLLRTKNSFKLSPDEKKLAKKRYD
jgi:hypothetical protein